MAAATAAEFAMDTGVDNDDGSIDTSDPDNLNLAKNVVSASAAAAAVLGTSSPRMFFLAGP